MKGQETRADCGAAPYHGGYDEEHAASEDVCGGAERGGLFLLGALGMRRAAPTNGDAGRTTAHARALGKRGAEPLAIRPRYAWKGSTSTDDWDTCNDATGGYPTPSSTFLNAHFDVSTGMLTIQTMQPSQVQNVYNAAFATCLMTDFSDSGPAGNPAKAWQHDVLRVPSGN